MAKLPPLPPRLDLAHRPTPVQRLSRLSERHGVELLAKRDDLTGMALSGNKIRKLEFSLAEARARGSTAVITTGGVQSNHCRATAVAARQVGLTPHLLLRTADGEPPATSDGNLFLDRLLGAELRFVTPGGYKQRYTVMSAWAEELRAAGQRPFVIPEGASDALGALGYVAAAGELARQAEQGRIPGGRMPDFIVHACGSGGTAAGLAAGLSLLGAATQVVAYAVLADEHHFRARIDGIGEEMARRWPALKTGPLAVELDASHQGRGYALSTPEELAFIRDVARLEGLLLDPVYTGKAMRGLVSDLEAGRRYPPGSTVMFLHTGGLFGLFPERRRMVL